MSVVAIVASFSSRNSTVALLLVVVTSKFGLDCSLVNFAVYSVTRESKAGFNATVDGGENVESVSSRLLSVASDDTAGSDLVMVTW